jgi:hypothetical protein
MEIALCLTVIAHAQGNRSVQTDASGAHDLQFGTLQDCETINFVFVALQTNIN